MKPKLNVLVSHSDGDFIIRPMAKSDVTSYANAMSDNSVQRKFIREQMLKKLDYLKEHEEDCNYIFIILYGSKFYGTVQTTARDISGTEANVLFYLPVAEKLQELNTNAVKAFISMCKETHVYDEKLYIVSYEQGKEIAYVVNLAGSKD